MLAAASLAATVATSSAKVQSSMSFAMRRSSLQTNEEIKLFADDSEGLENVIPKSTRLFDEHLSKLHHSGIWQERRLIACSQFVYVLMPSDAPAEQSGQCKLVKDTSSDSPECHFIHLQGGYLTMYETEEELTARSSHSGGIESSLHSTKILQLNKNEKK